MEHSAKRGLLDLPYELQFNTYSMLFKPYHLKIEHDAPPEAKCSRHTSNIKKNGPEQSSEERYQASFLKVVGQTGPADIGILGACKSVKEIALNALSQRFSGICSLHYETSPRLLAGALRWKINNNPVYASLFSLVTRLQLAKERTAYGHPNLDILIIRLYLFFPKLRIVEAGWDLRQNLVSCLSKLVKTPGFPQQFHSGELDVMFLPGWSDDIMELPVLAIRNKAGELIDVVLNFEIDTWIRPEIKTLIFRMQKEPGGVRVIQRYWGVVGRCDTADAANEYFRQLPGLYRFMSLDLR